MPLSEFFGRSTTTVQGLGGIIATIGGFGTQSSSSTSTSTSTSTTSNVQVGTTGYNGTIFAGGAPDSRGGKGLWALGLTLGLGLVL